MRIPPTARLLPLLTTACLLLASLTCVVIWARNIGIQEDWNMVPAWLGKEPHLVSWLWSQNNEHRLPVGRLLYLLLLRVTDDFRSGMVANQILLAMLCLILINSFARGRGNRFQISDLVIPLAILHLGHWENLMWGWQLQFVTSTFLSGILLAVLICSDLPHQRGAIWAAISFVLLPLTGANGIAIALGMSPWGLLVAYFFWRSESPHKITALVMFGGVFLCWMVTILYFVGYTPPPWSPPLANLTQLSRAVQAYFAMATGPWSRMADGTVAIVVLLTLTAGIIFAGTAFLSKIRAGDVRGFGLATFIGSNTVLGFIIALTRGAYPYPMPARYALFAALPLLAAIISLQLYAPPKISGKFSVAAAAFFMVVLPLNVRAGFEWRDWYLQGMRHYEQDVASGLSLPAIAERNTPFLLHSCNGCLLRYLRILRDQNVEPFDRLPQDGRSHLH